MVKSERLARETMLLIIVHELPHKAAHSTQKDCLYPFMPIHNTVGPRLSEHLCTTSMLKVFR